MNLKEKLKHGIKVKLRDGSFCYVVVYKTYAFDDDILLQCVDKEFKHDWHLNLNDYDDDLKCIDNPEYDVVEIFDYVSIYKIER